MSTPIFNDVRTRAATLAVTKVLSQQTWIAALCPPAPEWNGIPPTPDMDNPHLEQPFVYLRSFAVGFLSPDEAGEVAGQTPDGELLKYAFSDDPTDTLFVKVHAPIGSFAGQELGAIALYSNPALVEGVPAGKEVLLPADVVEPGTLSRVAYMTPTPLFAGTGLTHFFIDRY
ncbi:hypothetical protein [Pseudovibrio sp. Tun.PSC04-5.I4]|uniref:hypothetical protein n=1 Tax=Pseudovibrio sp. Tun.PSC04-5.I4 TaxID=1798213 RepID=UPI0008859815|nr:hypothetical protein [Pseudovibrio sp. Tun.PSC04-5.I4]SDQ99828.1 hypothetical protein SAMN04515695_2240 [Pseudovibrio sp. Tun.PSC04-5.I4]